MQLRQYIAVVVYMYVSLHDEQWDFCGVLFRQGLACSDVAGVHGSSFELNE